MTQTAQAPTSEDKALRALQSILNRAAPGGFPVKRLDGDTAADIARIAKAAIAAIRATQPAN